jgi:CIC family chloride channel protein
MRTDFERVPADLPAPRLQALIAGSRSNSFVVVDSEERMLGLLTLQDLRTLDMETARELGALAIAADFAERDVVTVFPDETLAEALARMDRHGFRQLPVVTRDDPRRVLGMLERRHVISAYQRALQDSPSAR